MKLPRHHQHLYRAVPYTRAGFSWAEELPKMLGFAFIFGLVGLVHPFFRRRYQRVPSSWEEYKAQLPVTFLVWLVGTLVVAGIYLVRE